jgi:hypothetical protein
MITEEQKKKWLSGELSFEEKEDIVHSGLSEEDKKWLKRIDIPKGITVETGVELSPEEIERMNREGKEEYDRWMESEKRKKEKR